MQKNFFDGSFFFKSTLSVDDITQQAESRQMLVSQQAENRQMLVLGPF